VCRQQERRNETRKKICGSGYNPHGPEARRVGGGGVLIQNDKEHDNREASGGQRTGRRARCEGRVNE